MIDTCLSECNEIALSVLPQHHRCEIALSVLPLEIIVIILEQLPLKDLLNLSETNKELREIIKNVRLPHMIKLRRNVDKQLEHIIKNYNFINFDLSDTYVTGKGLRVLNNYYCHTVSLYNCDKVTDEGIKALSNCHTVNLQLCDLVTDEGIKALNNCHTVNLRFCRLVTDEGIKALSNCHTVYLSNCDLVTDKGIKALSNCHTIDLSSCNKVTDEGIKALSNCHTVKLSFCNKVTDKSIKALRNCHTVNILGRYNREGIKALKNNGCIVYH